MNNTLISAALQNTANEKINKIVAVIFIRHFPFKVPIFDNLIIYSLIDRKSLFRRLGHSPQEVVLESGFMVKGVMETGVFVKVASASPGHAPDWLMRRQTWQTHPVLNKPPLSRMLMHSRTCHNPSRHPC